MEKTDLGSFIRVSKLTSKSDELVHLDIVFSKDYPGLWQSLCSEEEIKKYIENNIDAAYQEAIQKIDDCHYILNCEMLNKDGLYISEEKWEKAVGESIIIFLPIIQKFLGESSSHKG